jgi:ADP-heptose:LPS heptosyltransferase
MSVATRLKEYDCEVHWATRSDLADLVGSHPFVDQVWSLDRKKGLMGLFQLISELRAENFTHIYDAHNNLRSSLISLFLRWPLNPWAWAQEVLYLKKPKNRLWRFLLFNFRINKFPQPFSGQRDLLEPLKAWGLSEELPSPPQILIDDKALSQVKDWMRSHLFPIGYVVLCPSASYELKRWPLTHWQQLINLNPDHNFLILGGPQDQFIDELVECRKGQLLKSIGKLSLNESVAAIALSQAVVSNDTGLLHVAEQLGKKAIALMGPAPFGFPSRESTLVLEIKLACRPCSKHGQGPCRNKTFQQCLVDIRPEFVSSQLERILRYE